MPASTANVPHVVPVEARLRLKVAAAMKRRRRRWRQRRRWRRGCAVVLVEEEPLPDQVHLLDVVRVRIRKRALVPKE